MSLGAQFPAFLLVLPDPEVEGTTILRKVRSCSPNDTSAHARTPEPPVPATAVSYQNSNNNMEYLIPTGYQLAHGYDQKKASKRFYVIEINSLILTTILIANCGAGGGLFKHSLRTRMGRNCKP